MLNRQYTFPIKATGPSNCIYDGQYYGDDNFTWNFLIHWPVMTVSFVQSQLAVNITESTGSTEKAEATLLKIARISREYIMSRAVSISRKNLEYRVAKDEDLLIEILLFQLEILQTWGGYNSLYRVTDSQNQQSIGKAAEDYILGTDVFTRYYTWRIEDSDYRSDY